ncbi:MAG: TIR domain-containing protein [Clostridia bacterium]|nr:TIR domain-containing protein [Clostridia bacterium]
MAIFKCKMCGGDLEIIDGMSVAECQYCGTQQTLPRLDDEKRANLYDRAGHFRRNNDFDKAISIYEKILEEDRTDAEAYWSLVLCKYGIEYVEDPSTHKRVPTVNRAQYISIFADSDYKSAIEYADTYQKSIYESEAKLIDDIQKGILEISNKEEPFDVFICYKETDNNGRRTPDSVLATDLYHQLTNEGFKVFFSRITLEDKLGTAYEPYIFAALNSAKVMVVLGTRPEYFNAVWVKNEWSRYLSIIKNGENKILIPAYKDMDPYDLPEEFSHLQAQDMSKLGFMQDLIRGIQKITYSNTEKTTSANLNNISSSTNGNIAPLIDRAFLCIEDGEFNKADELLEQVLNLNPREPKAYIGKLLCELKLKKEDDLASLDKPLWNYNNYNKAIRFSDEKEIARIEKYNNSIIDKINKKIHNVDEKINSLTPDLNNKKQELITISEQRKAIAQSISEQEQQKNNIKKDIEAECKRLEMEYEKLSVQRRKTSSLSSGFLKKIESIAAAEKITSALEKINNEIRNLKQSISSNPIIKECDEKILRLKKEQNKNESISAEIGIVIASMDREISQLNEDKKVLASILENNN